MKKSKLWILCVIFLVCSFSSNILSVNAKTLKTVKSDIVVMEGATRLLTQDTYQSTYKVSNKKIATVIKNGLSSVSTVAPKADIYDYGFLLKGKKPGKTKITVTTDFKKYIYSVTVISKASIQKASKKAMIKFANTLTDTKQCSYMDFNGDGIKELYHDGYFSYYNYVLKKVVTKPFSSDKSVTQVTSLLVSPKSNLLFAIPANEIFKGDPDPDHEMYSGTLYGQFAFFNEEKVFDLLTANICFLKYKHPKEFVGDKYVEGTDYYCLDVPEYEDDDYWYESYTKNEMDKKLEEILLNAIKVEFTTKPKIND